MKQTNSISLYELNSLVKGVLNSNLSSYYWIKAETSDVRINQNGHCYLEFIEKDNSGKNTVAKARGMIWANTFYLLKAFFEETTKQPFTSGIKVLVQVSVTFHELYGYSLTVHDIDPSYTLGDQAMHRAAIIKQLEEEGVLDMNKELELPTPMNRIAIISSPTAAGYEDFMHQIKYNLYEYAFYTKLFPAIMQGEKTENSIIEALEKIYDYQDLFDAVVIIRGGGATSDLSGFDSYLLAANCAQFPLPIITGIGHERDETVLDIVAHTRAKTPTAVAEFLISEMENTMQELLQYQFTISDLSKQLLHKEITRLNTYEIKNTYALKDWSKQQSYFLESALKALKISSERNKRENIALLENLEKQINLISPQNLLEKGYTFTLKDGKMVKSATEVKSGEQLETVFKDGKITSTAN